MNLFDLIPSADSIPVHWGWFKVLLIAGFMGHILLMNIMLGTSIISFFTPSSQKNVLFHKDISEKLPVVIAFVINLGVVPLLFLQVLYGNFFYVSSQLMGVYWLSVIGVLILAYYSAYYYKFKFEALVGGKFFLGIALVIFLGIGFLFSNNMTLMLNPQAWTAYFNQPGGTLLNLSDPALIPRYLHFMTASVAVGGLFIAIVWSFKKENGADTHVARGMKWFIYATLLQIFIGFWFQMALPKQIMRLFMGQSFLHTALFAIALILVVQTLYFAFKTKVWPCTASLFILLLNMIFMRDLVRTAYLRPYFNAAELDVTGQYSSLIMFLAAFIITIGAVVYVLRLAMDNSLQTQE